MHTPRLRPALVTLAASLAAAAALTATPAGAADAPAASGPWATAWAGSPEDGATGNASCPSEAGVDGRTVRDVVTTTAAGSRLRVRLSNAFGATALRVGHASVARQAGGAAVDPGTLRDLTFHGRRTVDIPAGQEVFSDPVKLSTTALGRLAVSIYVPHGNGPATQHNLGVQDSYLSAAGDHAGAAGGTAYPTAISCRLLLSGVDIQRGPAAHGTVVTLGDSITDGYGSTANADHRWPDYLARRLAAVRTGPVPSLANAAISGNEVLVDRVPVYFGISALHRLDRDVLDQSGARSVIVLEGINDIGAAHASAASLIKGYQQIIDRAHARGLRIYGATLVPFGGSTAFGGDYGSAYGEQQRLAVNQWIRTSGAYDAVIDFDKAVRDPADPSRLLPAYDSGDHLHPGDLGYRVMADTVDLGLLTRN